jgi:fatty acid desaturase
LSAPIADHLDSPPAANASSSHASSPGRALRGDAELKRRLQEFCATDNWTNWLYIFRAWVVIVVSIFAVALAYGYVTSAAALVWFVPVAFAAMVCIGASQHQLAGATHEATHHTLFKNRLLNELASDWFCAFPTFSTTYSFRLYHLVHHQFINDPARDPDFMMLAHSGHWLDFPVSAGRFMRMVLKQALVLPLLHHALVRFKYNAVGVEGAGAYQRKGKSSKLPERLGFAWLAGLAPMLVYLSHSGEPWRVAAYLVLYWLWLAIVYLVIPDRLFTTARLKPAIPRRYIATGRFLFVTLVAGTLTCAQIISGQPVWWFFLGLWFLPALTVFPFFMILRQVVQHGNRDRGWLSNSRVFLVHPLLKYAVFPFGMDYHLPHHMYATVPHYRLPALHAFLLRFPEYRDDGPEVENYVVPSNSQPRRPTIVEVLGPEYARRSADVFIDHSVLDGWDVDEKEEITGGATG